MPASRLIWVFQRPGVGDREPPGLGPGFAGFLILTIETVVPSRPSKTCCGLGRWLSFAEPQPCPVAGRGLPREVSDCVQSGLIRTSPPSAVCDRPLGVLGLRDKFGVTIVAVKRPGGTWRHTTAQTVLYDNDQIIFRGSKAKIERFSTLP